MTVHSSYQLDVLAQQKCDEGCREQIKAIAVEVVRTGIAREMVQSMEMFQSWGWFRTELVVTLVRVNQAVLVFHEEPDSVMKKIGPMIPRTKKNVPTPEKVFVKMLATRINNMLKGIKSHNGWVQQSNEVNEKRQREDPHSNWAVSWKPEPVITIPDEIRSVQCLRDTVNCPSYSKSWTSRLRPSRAQWTFREVEKQMKPLFERQEMNDQVVSQAWDLVVAGEMMDE